MWFAKMDWGIRQSMKTFVNISPWIIKEIATQIMKVDFDQIVDKLCNLLQANIFLACTML